MHLGFFAVNLNGMLNGMLQPEKSPACANVRPSKVAMLDAETRELVNRRPIHSLVSHVTLPQQHFGEPQPVVTPWAIQSVFPEKTCRSDPAQNVGISPLAPEVGLVCPKYL